ncbi:methyl-accepting chemotaxis protein [Candidatus Parabeggiatoa sp. HSG14]|uniref:methyl-accepting chemotaxis protein n=1 Tax=Candidatus Parabeggiatoa sp. HSG14 TaxID=3055593 RepID=UPI0025A6D922|nr:methyl-accepting chemotaxis protein [Thiotrichales bacterium HSG14]
MKIGTKLLIVALAIGFIPVAIVGSIALLNGREALSNQAFSQLESVREVKKAQLEAFFQEKKREMHVLLDIVATLRQNAFQKLQTVQENKKAQLEWYFQERLSDISVLSKSDSVSQAMEQFEGAFHVEGKNTDGLAWQSIEERFGPELKQYKEKYGYHDLLLIAKDGDIVYTAAKGSDFGQNLLNSHLKNTPLNKAFQEGFQEIVVHDFMHTPDNKQQVAFLTAPVFRFGEIIGILAFSLLPDAINAIVQRHEGMGKTGETYLVGQSNDQTSYRSNRIIKGKGQHIIGYPKSGEDIDKALSGKSSIDIKMGSKGELELGGYAPLKVSGLNWCIITTISLEELLTPKLVEGGEDFFTKYILQYDYYDLFLIHPDGEIFYTVKHESDYGTNIIRDEYANSQFSQFVKKVLKTRSFDMSDYAPYQASNNLPSAFIAQPLLHGDEIELIVALQLSDKMMNRIMQQRVGMGDTGETYLVGEDKLMRSNSYLAPDTHSIRASFANPTEGSVNTESSQKALAGETGKTIINNYQGDLVLSAYTPITVGDKQWALIAEISQAEAFAPIKTLEWLIGIIVILGIPIIIGVALWFSRSITCHLSRVVEVIRQLSNGKLTRRIGFTPKEKKILSSAKKNEICLMLRATLAMSETLQGVILDIQKTVLVARNGDLTQRVDTTSLKGFMKELGESTNQLVTTTSDVMEDMTRVMTALAQGHLNEKIKNHYEGIYAEVATSAQTTIETLQKTIFEIQEVVNGATDGKWDKLITLSNKKGFSKDLSHAVNALIKIQKNFSDDIGIFLENLTNGDLTKPIQSEYTGGFDRIKQNANSAIEKLVSTLSEISLIADAVKNAAIEIENGNNSLSSRTEEQAASLEETAASMEQLTITVDQNANHAKTAHTKALSAVEVAEDGGMLVGEAVDTMQRVRESSKKISEIINIINSIAFQTNILALNAAVEAARAGEHGRGFAVVATEVRSLAQRSAESAQEVKALIEDSVSNIKAGTTLVEKAGESMHEIVASIQQVKNIISDISTASLDQSNGIRQINTTIVQMDNMTQQNAALVEEAAVNASILTQQAVKLTEAFGQFKFRQ